MMEVLTPQALAFVHELQRRFGSRRDQLLAARSSRRLEIARTGRIDFDPATAEIRDGDWRVPPAPAALRDRRVEITGPTERKMSINALNSGASVWLADLEDANTPHWTNVVDGQVNLYEAIRGTISFESPDGRLYSLNEGALPTIVMRPRGWHLDERHVVVDDKPAVAALVDVGLFMWHNASELTRRERGPFLYLPKMEAAAEAALWHDVFAFIEERLGLPHGQIRATVLIETITAAFQMHEILHALGPYATGLNAGRWDYLFSLIKNFRDAGKDFVLPDRGAVTMTAPFLRAYTELLVATCHRRGAHAIGGMAAFIPSRRDPAINEIAFAKVREDKQREAGDGFDGSWVAHPDLVPLCREIFDAALGDRPHQLDRLRSEVSVGADDLLNVSATPGAITEAGLRTNIAVGVTYIHAWLEGNGAVAINNLMEDAATAEISRSQIWQWLRNAVTLEDGKPLTPALVREILLEQTPGPARDLFEDLVLSEDFTDFLTIPGYELIP